MISNPSCQKQITFIHTEELVERSQTLTPKERKMQCKEFGAVFLIGIGGELPDGKPHDGRALTTMTDYRV